MYCARVAQSKAPVRPNRWLTPQLAVPSLEISWTKPPPLSPTVGTRLSKPAFARLEALALTSGNDKASIMRELIKRGWAAAFDGEDMDVPM